MEAIRRCDEQAYNYLSEIPPEKWSLACDGGFRYGIMTTNMSESFNGVMKGARCLPIKALVEASFYKANSYFVSRFGQAQLRSSEGHDYTLKLEERLRANFKKIRMMDVIPFSMQANLFEVVVYVPMGHIGSVRRRHTVNLEERTCTCQRWHLYHFPCSHVLAVCRNRSLAFSQYVSP